MATKFRPYRGTEEKIQNISYSEGFIYFATDTGHIYLDYNGERLTMGGNGASVFYANDTDVLVDNLTDNYYLDINTFANPNASVKMDDLIINSDGSFYRVVYVNETSNRIECKRIAVSGSGGSGGGSGGGGSGGDITSNITLKPINNMPYTFIYGQAYEMRFLATAEYDSKINIGVRIDGINGQNKFINYLIDSGKEFGIDIGSLLYLGENKITISASADISGYIELPAYRNRNVVEMKLLKLNTFNPRLVRSDSLPFACTIYGKEIPNKVLKIYIDNILVKEEPISSTFSDGGTANVNVPKQSHGAHTLTAILSANINGTIVSTDPITYQIAWAEKDNLTPIIWFPNEYPTSIIQYQDLIIEYMVWEGFDTEKEIKTYFYKSGKELTSRILKYDITTSQRWHVTDYEVGNNNYTIRVGSTSKPVNVYVEEDTEHNLNIRTGGLILNLDSAGRSNDENISKKISWISTGTDEKTAVSFNNFNWYNNGWIVDEDGHSCLRISNGASIKIPITPLKILNTDAIDQPVAFDFRFKVRNVQEYSTLVTTTSVEDEKGNLIITKEVNTDKGVFGGIYKNFGFCLGTQEAFFRSSGTIVNARYCEDEIINLTFVIDHNSSNLPMIYIYLQGILSGVAKYDKSNDKFNSGASFLEFNSTYCDVDLYNVRIYKGIKLESSDVVHNYVADRKSIKDYDANFLINTAVNFIDYNAMEKYNEDHPDETIMPYMVLDAHGELLPFVKDGKKAVDIKFCNPALDYAYENGLITDEQYLYGAPSFTFTSEEKSLDVQGTSSQGYPRRNYKWKAKQEDAEWRYTGGPLKGQPIYEYNAEEKKYEGSKLEGKSYKKYYLDSTIGESTFCFKADYMESSGTHNTGYASFVSTLYNKHPLKDYFPETVLPKSLRTTVYGFPMLVFNKIGENSYEFIGRYNFNLDKSSTDSCGFTYDADSYIFKEYKLTSIKDQTEFNSGEFYLLENEEYIKALNWDSSKTYYKKTYYPMEEIAECWEIKNNQGQRTSFTRVDFEETTDAYSVIKLNSDTFIPNVYYTKVINATAATESYVLASEFNPNSIYYTKKSGVLSVLNDFEYRYSAFKDEIDNAIKGEGNFSSKPQSVCNETILHRMRNLKDLAVWLESTDVQDEKKLGSRLGEYTTVILTNETFEPTVHYIWNAENYKWMPTKEGDSFDATAKYATLKETTVEYDGIKYSYDSKDYRLAKFSNEFEEHFDLEYCRVYFIMTELLHLYDSRGKNCMLATWGPKEENGNYIWYPIFYDIDTQLGINNSGVPSWEYDVNPTDEDFFSTANSVLWTNLWATRSKDIMSRYIELRKNDLTINAMDGYYNAYPILGRNEIDSWKEILNDAETKSLQKAIVSYAKIGKRPAMIYNVDQYYKYIAPAISGFVNTNGVSGSKTETYFYCAQGTRDLMRYLYLRNRLNFVDSKWHGGSYSVAGAKGELFSRYNANVISTTSDKFLYTNDPNLHNTDVEIKQEIYKYWDWNNYGPHPLDCTPTFSGVRSYLKQYMSIQTDDSVFEPVYCDSKNPITLTTNSTIEGNIKNNPNSYEQIFNMGGGEYIADLGDLGLKYISQFFAPTLKRIKRLQLGSDIEGYNNGELKALDIGGSALTGEGKPNKDAKTLLEEVILTGLASLNWTIDLTGSEKLKTFRALNTHLTGVSLAEGVLIETLHLPNTISFIKLVEPVALNGVLTNPKNSEGKFNKGLYIDGITDATNYDKDINITTYDIIGGNLGYDSYKLLNTLVNFKLAMQARGTNPSLGINLQNVHWSPYSVVEYGELWDESKENLYYKDNSRFQLEPYTYEEKTWEAGTKNGKIYLIDNDYFNNNQNIITDLSIFDTFIDAYNTAVEYYNSHDGSMDKNYFRNTSLNQIYPTVPNISGIVYVNNEIPVDEAEITNLYNVLFPEIQFFFKEIKKAYMATYVTLIDGIEEVIYTERKAADSTDLSLTFPDPIKYTPARLNHDFLGWSQEVDAVLGGPDIIYHKDYTDNFEVEWNKLQFDTTSEIIKFYAIFTPTMFKVSFYNVHPNGTVFEKSLLDLDVAAGEYLSTPDLLPVTDEDQLSDTERYKLLGWVSEPKYSFPSTKAEGLQNIVTLEKIISENTNRVFYACYIKESVDDSETDHRYFNFTFKDRYEDEYDESYSINNGVYTCALKEGAKLSGKITVPGTYEGKPVVEFSGLDQEPNITHIYFKNPETMRALYGFEGSKELKVVDWPSGLRKLGGRAFAFCSKLKFDAVKFANTSLAHIGTNCFTAAFDVSSGGIPLICLPSTIRQIDTRAFRNINQDNLPAGNFLIEEVSFGDPNKPSNFNFDSGVNNAGEIFEQNELDIAPNYASASRNTPIKKFIYYKDPSNVEFTVERFKDYIDGSKVNGKNDVLEIGVEG